MMIVSQCVKMRLVEFGSKYEPLNEMSCAQNEIGSYALLRFRVPFVNRVLPWSAAYELLLSLILFGMIWNALCAFRINSNNFLCEQTEYCPVC